MAKDEPGADNSIEASGNKKLIIIGVAVIVVIILGAVAFLMMGTDVKQKATMDRAKTENGGHEESNKKIAAGVDSNIYPLEPFIIHIYDGQELRYLKVKMELEMTDPTTKSKLDASHLQIRDAILVLLISKSYQELQDVKGKNQLKEEILAVISKIIPTGNISKVFFSDFIVL